jgi:hypothetical protein
MRIAAIEVDQCVVVCWIVMTEWRQGVGYDDPFFASSGQVGIVAGTMTTVWFVVVGDTTAAG